MEAQRKLRITLWGLLLALVTKVSAFSPPNVVLVMAEGTGAGDFGFSGSGFEATPKIDALATSGVVFTDWSAASLSDRPGLRSVGKFPSFFQKAGYETHCIGPWKAEASEKAGFQSRSGTDTAESTGQSANQWLRTGRSDELPFFLAVSFPDATQLAKEAPDLVTFHREAGRRENAEFLAGLSIIDNQLGVIRKALQETSLSENTILIFTSVSARKDVKKPRGVWIDHLHVPLVLSWPKGIDGGRKISEPAWGHDLGATLGQLCGVKVEPLAGGVDLSALLGGEKLDARQISFHWEKNETRLIRKGRHLLVVGNGNEKAYDLLIDPNLRQNLWNASQELKALFADELK